MTATIRRTSLKPAPTVRISVKLDTAVSKWAKRMKMSKAALVRNAIEEYILNELDLKAIEERKHQPSIPLAEVKQQLGL